MPRTFGHCTDFYTVLYTNIKNNAVAYRTENRLKPNRTTKEVTQMSRRKNRQETDCPRRAQRTAKKFPASAGRNVASSARAHAQEDVDRNGEAGSQTHTHLRALRQKPRPLPLHLRFRGGQTLLRLQFQPASATTGNRLAPPPWRENQEATHLSALGRQRGVGRCWRPRGGRRGALPVTPRAPPSPAPRAAASPAAGRGRRRASIHHGRRPVTGEDGLAFRKRKGNGSRSLGRFPLFRSWKKNGGGSRCGDCGGKGGFIYLSRRVVGPTSQASLSQSPLSQSGILGCAPFLGLSLRFIITRFDWFF
jgi:hypothetical protein